MPRVNPQRASSVIFDIDGTITNLDHRLKFIDGSQPKDWDLFTATMSDDSINVPVVQVLLAMRAQGFDILLVTGRREQFSTVTMDWMDMRHIPYAALFMRKEGDDREVSLVKRDLLVDVHDAGWDPKTVFEAGAACVDMWRAEGLTCLQVAANLDYAIS